MKAKKMLLGVLAGAALIGAGTATWKFAGNASNFEKGTVIVAGYEIVGGVKIDGKLTLTIDETPSWSLNTIKATYEANGGHVPSDLARTYSITYSDNLKTYLTFGTSTGSWTDGGSITAPTVDFVSGKNPTTKTAYDAMVSALSGATITITFEAKSATNGSQSSPGETTVSS